MLIFIYHQSHHLSENNPEHNWNSRKESSATNYYNGPKQRKYYKPDTYNKGQQYDHDRTTNTVPSINLHERGEVDDQSSIHIGIPTPYIKHILVVALGTEQK